MKNKEIEELLNNIKEQLIIDEKLGKEIAQDFHKTILNYEETKLLLSHIEQLENNRDKAIEYLEKSKLNQLDTHCKYLYIDFGVEKIENIDELINILKGDSDNE